MKSSFEHCTEEALELYALNRLDEGNSEHLEEHILICENCRIRLDAADHYVHAMRTGAAALQKEAVSQPASRWFSLDWFRMPTPTWAAAAVAVFAVALISLTQLRHVNNGNPISINLVAERGSAISAPAHRVLNLKLDARGLDLGAHSRIELVDARGHMIEEATAVDVEDSIEMRTGIKLNPGGYFVRVYGADATEPAREFALNVK